MPLPSLVNVPLPVPIVPVMVVLAAPPTVRPWPAPVMLPDTVSVPAAELIRLAEPSATLPEMVLLPV